MQGLQQVVQGVQIFEGERQQILLVKQLEIFNGEAHLGEMHGEWHIIGDRHGEQHLTGELVIHAHGLQ